MVRERADIFMVSEMSDQLVKDIFMTPFSSLQEAYDEAVRRLGPDASVIIMPYGGSTLPVLSE
jgi:nickel-dependent lactate racemase